MCLIVAASSVASTYSGQFTSGVHVYQQNAVNVIRLLIISDQSLEG